MCDRAEAPGKNQQRRPRVEKQLGGILRDAGVVAAEHQDRVRADEFVIQPVVVPDPFDERAKTSVYQTDDSSRCVSHSGISKWRWMARARNPKTIAKPITLEYWKAGAVDRSHTKAMQPSRIGVA